MTLDSSVMNVSIATVAEDVGTTVTGIQTAITLYTLVMASLMITGGKIGEILGRKRAFAIGCVIYGAGSLTTALAPNLAVLILGWSLLEGIGAALIMPAIVALVASNFAAAERPRAYGLVAAVGRDRRRRRPADRRALHDLRLVAVGVRRRGPSSSRCILAHDPPDGRRRARPRTPRLDLVGTGLSALGLGLVVFGILRRARGASSTPSRTRPSWLGLSPVVWLVTRRAVSCCSGSSRGRTHVSPRAARRSLDPDDAAEPAAAQRPDVVLLPVPAAGGAVLLRSRSSSRSRSGCAPSTPASGILPLSVTLLLAAVGVSRSSSRTRRPGGSCAVGFLALLAGIVVADRRPRRWAPGRRSSPGPLLLAGLGIGALSSQLGAVTVSAVPDEQSGEVGGLQNTFTNLGASIGTALAGAVLISALTSSFLTGIEDNEAVPDSVTSTAQVELASGIPFVSDALEPGSPDAGVDAGRRRRDRRGERRGPRSTGCAAPWRCSPCSRCSPSPDRRDPATAAGAPATTPAPRGARAVTVIADLERADPPLAVLPDQPHGDGPHPGAVLHHDGRLDDAVDGLADPHPPHRESMPGAGCVALGDPAGGERAAAGDHGVDLGARPAHHLRAPDGPRSSPRAARGDARGPGGGVGQVGPQRALRAEELLVGCRREVDRERALDVAGATLLRLHRRAGTDAPPPRARSAAAGGGSAGRRAGRRRSRPHLLRRAQDLTREEHVGVGPDDSRLASYQAGQARAISASEGSGPRCRAAIDHSVSPRATTTGRARPRQHRDAGRGSAPARRAASARRSPRHPARRRSPRPRAASAGHGLRPTAPGAGIQPGSGRGTAGSGAQERTPGRAAGSRRPRRRQRAGDRRHRERGRPRSPIPRRAPAARRTSAG